jgi:hypothetical protein
MHARGKIANKGKAPKKFRRPAFQPANRQPQLRSSAQPHRYRREGHRYILASFVGRQSSILMSFPQEGKLLPKKRSRPSLRRLP